MYLLEVCYLKKNDHKVYYCHTLKITRYIRSTLLYALTYMQILRNNQQQNNATIFEEKEMGAVGEKKTTEKFSVP